MPAGTIIEENGKRRYFDKHGNELHDGDFIRHEDGMTERIYATEHGFLGVDATNPHWIESGRAVPCEYGIYPLWIREMPYIEKVTHEVEGGDS